MVLMPEHGPGSAFCLPVPCLTGFGDPLLSWGWGLAKVGEMCSSPCSLQCWG